MGGLAFLKAHAGLKKTSEKTCILAGLSTPFCLWASSKSTNSINMGLQLPPPGTWPTPSQNVTGPTQASFSLADSKGTIIKHQMCAEPATHNFIKSSQSSWFGYGFHLSMGKSKFKEHLLDSSTCHLLKNQI